MAGPGDPNDSNNAWGHDAGQQPPAGFGSAAPPPQSWAELPAGPAGSGGAHQARRVEVSTASLLLSAVPWFFWSFAVVSWIVGIIGFGWGWLLVLIWFASGAVVFVRPVEDALARYLFRLRQPTLVEDQRLGPIWRQLADRAGIPENRYAIWIQESDDPNAIPTPGHIIATTRWALYTLPPSHLEAMLAHELGHHLGGRDWLSLLSFWYSIPARCALIGVRALGRLMRAVPAVGCVVIGFVLLGYLGVLLAVLTFDDSFTLPLLFLTPLVAPPILAWLSRREVLQADRRAATMGYGATLIQVLYGWQFQHQHALGRDASRRSHFMASAPSLPDRVRGLEQLQQRP
ncbi:M48 family metalloprotease [Kribbella sp. CA-245084]|uniref:M48 family metalloprotease n=1 Tax=Kribbella sp. CA-245084 TaxID=3239940 RepID=UPI003D8C4A4E